MNQKMKITSFSAVIAICLAFSSCIVMSPKKYHALVNERDSLATRTGALEDTVAKLRADTMRLHHQIAELNNNINNLSDKYAALNDKYGALNNNYTSTNNQVSQLSSDLKKREARLKEVEDALKRRDDASNALKEKLEQALLGFKNSGLSVDIKDGKVYVSLQDKLLFPSGSIIINENGKTALQQLATVLNSQPDINISVEGHTDDKKVINLGQIKDNWDLSVLRATSVCRYLTETEKVDPHRLTATGMSEYYPADPGTTPDALAKNRRIEIVLTPKLDEIYNLIKQ